MVHGNYNLCTHSVHISWSLLSAPNTEVLIVPNISPEKSKHLRKRNQNFFFFSLLFSSIVLWTLRFILGHLHCPNRICLSPQQVGCSQRVGFWPQKGLRKGNFGKHNCLVVSWGLWQILLIKLLHPWLLIVFMQDGFHPLTEMVFDLSLAYKHFPFSPTVSPNLN